MVKVCFSGNHVLVRLIHVEVVVGGTLPRYACPRYFFAVRRGVTSEYVGLCPQRYLCIGDERALDPGVGWDRSLVAACPGPLPIVFSCDVGAETW